MPGDVLRVVRVGEVGHQDFAALGGGGGLAAGEGPVLVQGGDHLGPGGGSLGVQASVFPGGQDAVGPAPVRRRLGIGGNGAGVRVVLRLGLRAPGPAPEDGQDLLAGHG